MCQLSENTSLCKPHRVSELWSSTNKYCSKDLQLMTSTLTLSVSQQSEQCQFGSSKRLFCFFCGGSRWFTMSPKCCCWLKKCVWTHFVDAGDEERRSKPSCLNSYEYSMHRFYTTTNRPPHKAIMETIKRKLWSRLHFVTFIQLSHLF